ncbi:MAG: periplasmic-type flagellar collar protein FlbB [Spirochaetaceae bacterium]
MPDYRRVGGGPRVFLYLLLLLALIAGGIVWFDYLDLINARNLINPVLEFVGLRPDTPETTEGVDGAALLDDARLAKRREALDQQMAEIQAAREDLAEERDDLDRREQEIDAREEELTERENSFNQRVRQFENKRAAIEQNVRDLTSMEPDAAVGILEGYDDQLLIDTLRVTEALAQEAGEVSLVSVWLARLPADRVADIQRKMTVKPREE